MSTAVNFVKPFENPEMISRPQFTTLVGGKIYDKSLPKGYKGYYGLFNQMVDLKVLDRSAHVGSDQTPTWGWVFDYTQAVNSNTGVPFRQWTNLFSLNSKQASFIIKQALALVNAAKDSQAPVVPTPVPAQNHELVFSDEDTQPVSKSPEADGLPEGRYHLEGSDGYYVNVTKFKNGNYKVALEY
jgi:hypothetical protein